MSSKPTYEELEEELAFLKTSNNLIKKSPIVRFVWKNQKNWPVEYVSENVKNLFGYSVDDFVENKITYSEIIFPDDLQRVENEVYSRSKTGFYSIEHEAYRIICKSGEIKWLNDITLIRRNKSNEITHFEGIIIDISDQKEAQQTQQENEEKYRTVANFTYDWEYWVSPQGKFIYVSPSCKRITGYSQDEFKQNPELLISIVHPGDVDKIKGHNNKVLDNNEIDPIEFRIITKSGRERWIGHVCQIVYDSNGVNIGIRGSNRDITEHKKAEKTLSQFKKIVESTSGHMSFIDTNYVYREVNNSYIKAHKRKREEIVGHTIADIVGVEVFENVIKDKIDACFSGQIVKYEHWFDFVEIGRRYMEVSYYPYFNEDNIVSGVIVDSYDITERKLAEEKSIFLSEITQQASDSIITTDINFNITWVNDAFIKLFGYEFEDIIGRLPDLLNAEPLAAEIQKEIYETISTGNRYKGEALNIKKDGSVFHCEIEVFPMFDISGNIIAYSGHQRDITERKQVEETLQASEENYRLLTETMKDVVIKMSTTGELLYVSPSIEQFGGYISNEEIGQHISKYFSNKADLQRALELLTEVVKSPKSGDFEFLFKAKNKKPFYVEHTYMPLMKSGKIVAIQMVLRDISERRIAELALKESKEKYKDFVNHSPDIIYEYSNKRGGLFWSNKVEEILGFSPKEIINDPFIWHNSIHQDDKDKVQKAIKENKKGADYNIDYRIKTKQGKWIWLHDTFIHKSQIDDEIIIEGHATDITEQKEAEQALKESEDRLSKTIIAANDGMWDWNLVTDEVYFDARYYEMAGYTVDEFPYEFEEFKKRLHPDDVENVMIQAQQHLEGKIARFDVEFRFKKKSGDWLWIMGRGLIVERDKNNKPLRFIGTHTDITERKKIELALKESNKTKDKFFSIIAHDLKSPFNTLLGFSELLNEKFDEYSTEKKKRFIGIIYDGLQSTFKLLENLLHWSQSQKGIIDFNPEKIDLFLIIKEISDLLKQSAETKSIQLVNQITENVFVEADRDMLATILRNLFSNAIKYTHKGGEITIKTFIVPEEKHSEKHRQFVGISVNDTGVGIPKEIQSKLFDIGEITSMKGTENETGTGLGLILCKEFVEKHGGKIWVESKIDKGSSFNFTIPCK